MATPLGMAGWWPVAHPPPLQDLEPPPERRWCPATVLPPPTDDPLPATSPDDHANPLLHHPEPQDARDSSRRWLTDRWPRLTPAQRAFVVARDPAGVPGILRGIATAGAGKTTALTARIAWLIASGIARPDQILVLTFTREATAELRCRLAAALGGTATAQLTITTIHGWAWRVLRARHAEAGYPAPPTICGPGELEALLFAALPDRAGDRRGRRQLLTTLTLLEGHLATPALDHATIDAAAASAAVDRIDTDALLGIWPDLEQTLRRRGQVTMDGIVRQAWLAMTRPSVVDEVARRWPVALVDEYQDTSRAQHELLRTVWGRRPRGPASLTVVGDDDQSLYRWRGASDALRWMARDYPDLVTVALEHTHRCPPEIFAPAAAVVEAIPGRLAKQLRSLAPAGHEPELLASPSAAAEVLDAARWVQRRHQQGTPWQEIMVLCRQRRPLTAIRDELDRRGIPTGLLGAAPLTRHPAVEHLVAIITLATNPHAQPALDTVLRRGVDGAARGTAEILRRHADAAHGGDLVEATATADAAAGIGPHRAGPLRVLGQGLRQLRSAAIGGASAIEVVRRARRTPGGPDRPLRTDGTTGGTPADDEPLLRRVEDACERWQRRRPARPVDAWFDNLLLDTDHDDGLREEVRLGTIHAAKGLEARAVLVVGCEDGVLPGHHAIRTGALDDERRLLFVAMSRAREHLALSWARERDGEPRTRSRLLPHL